MTEQGFTLIEILIALLISTIIAVLTFTGLQQLLRIQHSLNFHNNIESQLQTVFWRMEQDTAQFQAAEFLDSNNTRESSFTLLPNQLTLITAQAPKFNPQIPSAGLIKITYLVKNNTLYRVSYPIQNQAFSTSIVQQPLLRHVTKITFLALDQKNSWHSSYTIPNASLAWGKQPQIKAIDIIIFFNNSQVHRIFPLINPLSRGEAHE